MTFYHGTSSNLNIDKVILPPTETQIQRESWRHKLTDKVFITNSVKSAIMYAKKACDKYGGHPKIYQVEPSEDIEYINDAQYICDSAIIIGEKIYE